MLKCKKQFHFLHPKQNKAIYSKLKVSFLSFYINNYSIIFYKTQFLDDFAQKIAMGIWGRTSAVNEIQLSKDMKKTVGVNPRSFLNNILVLQPSK